MADATMITAMAAIGGSLVGGISSFATTYVSQRYQGRRERVALELQRRELLYTEFIEKAATLFIDSLDKTLGDPSTLVGLGAIAARIRLSASESVVRESEAVMREIILSYGRPPIAPLAIFTETQESFADPLTAFTSACRLERETILRGF